MPPRAKSDLAPFSDWIKENCSISGTTRNTYVALVRSILHNAELDETSIANYISTRADSTASSSRAAWKLFCQFGQERGVAIPNPYRGMSRRPNPLGFNMVDLAEEQRYGGARQEAYDIRLQTTPMPKEPVLKVAEATLPPSLPPELRVLLRKWIRPMIEEIQKVGHRLSWRYTYYDDHRKVWQTAHPTVRHGWINMPDDLVEALAMWTHGSTEKPEDGPLIPSQPGGSEPFPTLLLLRQIEV
jgi:hypothetical protein